MGTNKVTKTFWAVLRFFNLLEPRKPVLSISKVFMWVMLGCMVYVLAIDPSNATAVMTAAGGQFLAVANYAFRRSVQKDVGELDIQRDGG